MTACIATYESDAAYHGDRSRLSGSVLELFARNPREYDAWTRGEFETEQTGPMRNGSFTHSAVLEPHRTESLFAVEPARDDDPKKCIDRRSKDYKKWRASQQGKPIVEREFFATFEPMVVALTSNPITYDLLRGEGGHNEQALHFEVAGRPMRAKLDRVIPNRDLIIELKTCKDADPHHGPNLWSWFRLGYHRKAWLYLEAYRQVYGRNGCIVHIFVETKRERPHVFVSHTYVDSPAAQRGEDDVRKLLDRLALCEKSGDFRQPWEPGAPGGQEMSLPLPGAILSELEFDLGTPELTMGGEVVNL